MHMPDAAPAPRTRHYEVVNLLPLVIGGLLTRYPDLCSLSTQCTTDIAHVGDFPGSAADSADGSGFMISGPNCATAIASAVSRGKYQHRKLVRPVDRRFYRGQAHRLFAVVDDDPARSRGVKPFRQDVRHPPSGTQSVHIRREDDKPRAVFGNPPYLDRRGGYQDVDVVFFRRAVGGNSVFQGDAPDVVLSPILKGAIFGNIACTSVYLSIELYHKRYALSKFGTQNRASVRQPRIL